MTTQMSEVTVGGDWAFFDQINGKDVEPGTYEVQWPDGSFTTEAIEIETSKRPVADMGHTHYCPVKEAVIVKSYHGVLIRIKALGLRLRLSD